jgi:hypothetical protein
MAKRKYKTKLPELDRRAVRYLLFRIKRGMVETVDFDLRQHAGAIEEAILKQLKKKSLVISGFTFTWDVSATNPYKVIEKTIEEWLNEGGSFEDVPDGVDPRSFLLKVDPESVPFLRRQPPAFTGQE